MNTSWVSFLGPHSLILINRSQIDVETAAANVLDIAALTNPSKIISKIKYHLLGHLQEDIIRFGPLVGVATEVFECFNAIFRYCSILSNHLSSSWDIAHQLAEQETMKHIFSRGWWAVTDGEWACSGSSVHNFITTDKILQVLIGWSKDVMVAAGKQAQLPPKNMLDARCRYYQASISQMWWRQKDFTMCRFAIEWYSWSRCPELSWPLWYQPKHPLEPCKIYCHTISRPVHGWSLDLHPFIHTSQ